MEENLRTNLLFRKRRIATRSISTLLEGLAIHVLGAPEPAGQQIEREEHLQRRELDRLLHRLVPHITILVQLQLFPVGFLAVLLPLLVVAIPEPGARLRRPRCGQPPAAHHSLR